MSAQETGMPVLFSSIKFCRSVPDPLREFIGLYDQITDLSPEIRWKNGNIHDRFLNFLQFGERELFREKIEYILEIFSIFTKC